MAVASQDIRLYRMAAAAIEDAPLLEARVWRACELVLNRGVRLVQDGDILALVASSNDLQYVVAEMKKVLPKKADLESLIEANIQMKYMSK